MCFHSQIFLFLEGIFTILSTVLRWLLSCKRFNAATTELREQNIYKYLDRIFNAVSTTWKLKLKMELRMCRFLFVLLFCWESHCFQMWTRWAGVGETYELKMYYPKFYFDGVIIIPSLKYAQKPWKANHSFGLTESVSNKSSKTINICWSTDSFHSPFGFDRGKNWTLMARLILMRL